MERAKMKKPLNPVIPDYTPRSERGKKEECHLVFTPCVHCGKKITDGYYGRYGDGGVCSKVCNTAQTVKPRYPAPQKKGEGDGHVSIPSQQDP